MVDCCLRTDGLGYQVFNVANEDMSVAATSDEVKAQFYPGVREAAPMEPNETFYSIKKDKEMLGFRPQYSWRDVLEP